MHGLLSVREPKGGRACADRRVDGSRINRRANEIFFWGGREACSFKDCLMRMEACMLVDGGYVLTICWLFGDKRLFLHD